MHSRSAVFGRPERRFVRRLTEESRSGTRGARIKHLNLELPRTEKDRPFPELLNNFPDRGSRSCANIPTITCRTTPLRLSSR
jgi:hypothetical protein